MVWLVHSKQVRCMESQIAHQDANNYLFIMKEYIILEGLETHSPPCQISSYRLTIWRAKFKSDACFLSMESEHQEQMMVWELKGIDSLDHEALFIWM